MQFLAPRDSGVLHFRGDHCAGGLGGEQELEPLPAVIGVAFDAGERLLLGGVLAAEGFGGVPGRPAQAGIIKQRALLCRRRRRLQHAGWLGLVVLGQLFRVLRIRGVGGELRVRQNRTAQGEVIAAFQFHAGGKQRRVPVLGAVPDPAWTPVLESAHDAGQLGGGNDPGLRSARVGGAVGGEFLQGCALSVGGEQQVHRVNSALWRAVACHVGGCPRRVSGQLVHIARGTPYRGLQGAAQWHHEQAPVTRRGPGPSRGSGAMAARRVDGDAAGHGLRCSVRRS
ncbi:hypothetical protein BJG92_02146 [Arthrobacter sp. SO5]|nr:hypothetical protein [Arthrobacter sp. SO5]